MSKFYPMCNKVTNCTDNCKSCLEEERLETKFQIGDKVVVKDMSLEELKGSIGTIVDERIPNSQWAMIHGVQMWVVEFDNPAIRGAFRESELTLV